MNKKLITCLAALSFSVYGNNPTSSTDQTRQFSENETGLMYTFSRVNLGGLHELNIFRTDQSYTDPNSNDILKFNNKNFSLEEANQFTFNYLQTLNSPCVKVFWDLDYLHADGKMHMAYAPFNDIISHDDLGLPFQPIAYSISTDPLFGDVLFTNSDGDFGAELIAQFRSHFDLADTQAGVTKRFYRTKNIDFSLMGGIDIDFLNFSSTLQFNEYYKNDGQTANIGERDFTLSFKSRYYGGGPLAGALFQVPFNHDALRLNLKVEGSVLMGYGSAYVRREMLTDNPYGSPNTYVETSNRQRHNFRLVPTLRATVSMDIIIRHLMITGGLQQAIYFQAFDISPLNDSSQFSLSDTSTRSAYGKIVTGGPFVKLSYLF